MTADDVWKCLVDEFVSGENCGGEMVDRRDLAKEEQVRGTVITC